MEPVDSPALGAHHHRATLPLLLTAYAAQAACVLLVAFFAAGLSEVGMEVPIGYRGDSIALLAYIKGMLLNQWVGDIKQLSAPLTFDGTSFPIATSTDWLLMKLISLANDGVGFVANAFWLFSMVASAGLCALALQLIGVRPLIALLSGVAYAFLPYTFMRAIAHLNLVYYLVPLLCMLALHVASSFTVGAPHQRQIRAIGYTACVAQGFNYIYFSFFGAILLAVATMLGYSNSRNTSVLRVGLASISILLSATAINLAPTFWSWHANGKPPESEYKIVAEAELYGAKLRRMLAPHHDNSLPGLRQWGERDLRAAFPNENENVTTRLGLLCGIGLLNLLLASLQLPFARKYLGTSANSLPPLALFTYLAITVGGLGAIFNVLVAPDIRAYNRFSVFLAWFALAAIALSVHRLLETKAALARHAAMATFIILLLVSLYDQLLDSQGISKNRVDDRLRYSQDVWFASLVDSKFVEGGSVFQLPIASFPIDRHYGGMASYDHLRPFLWTRKEVRWSTPSYSQLHRAWQTRVAGLSDSALLDALAFSGFDLVWIDRAAYKDRGESLITSLLAAGAELVNTDGPDRIALLNMQVRNADLRKRLGEDVYAENVALWRSPAISLGWEGFYHEEQAPNGSHFRWSKQSSFLPVLNNTSQALRLTLAFDVEAGADGWLIVTHGNEVQEIKIGKFDVHISESIEIPAKSKMQISFVTNAPQVIAPADPRQLFFRLKNFRYEVVPVEGR